MPAVRVGVIGTGFGSRVVAPVFDATDGCEVVDVVSPRDDDGVSALCARSDVDLISVHSPPFMHRDHVGRAIAAGHAVACDKPFGCNSDDATAMLELAQDAGVVNIVNFEFRYDPVREQLRALMNDGAIGVPEHFSATMVTGLSRTPLRHYGWLFDRDRGGGWIGAFGSHLIDFAGWTFGDIVTASGDLRTTITERPDADGVVHRCTAEDGFTATLHAASGAIITIDSTSAATTNLPPRTVVIGTDGVIEVGADQQITLHTAADQHETVEVPTGDGDPYLVPARKWALAVRDAVRLGDAAPGTPTFTDGLACARVMDQLRG